MLPNDSASTAVAARILLRNFIFTLRSELVFVARAKECCRAEVRGATLNLGLGVEQLFVHVAPLPAFAGLDGLHDRVLGGVEMFGGVLVFRGIAAAHFSAFQAEPQVHPGVADFEAFFAALGVCGFTPF